MQGMYSMRSPAVKRLMKEAQELSEPTEQYYCQPLEDNLFEWHFTIRGPADTEFDGGLYHGRIVLPPEYPMKPPSIILLTHNGRFEVNKKICLSISGHHPESWQPSWSIRTALLAIIGFMPTHGAGALGSLDYSPDERKVLARRSVDFKCPDCGPINCTLKAVTEASLKTTEEARQLAAQMDFKDEKERNAALKDAGPASPSSPANTSVDTDQAAPSSSDAQGGARPKVPTTQAYPQPIQFGQFPMPMPFLPPFPMSGNAQNNQQNGSAILQQVPRFPLPFGAPMSPPFHPFMAPPFMPGMNFPPIPPGGLNPGTPLINTNITPNHPQVVPETVASLNNQSQSSSVTQPTESANQQTDNNPQTQTTATENPSQTSDTTTTATPNPDETSTTSSEGLRQRNRTRPDNVGSPSPRVSVTTSRTHAAPVIPTRSQRESPAFVVFAVIIIALIAMLLIRRLYIMKYLTGLI